MIKTDGRPTIAWAPDLSSPRINLIPLDGPDPDPPTRSVPEGQEGWCLGRLITENGWDRGSENQ